MLAKHGSHLVRPLEAFDVNTHSSTSDAATAHNLDSIIGDVVQVAGKLSLQ